MRMTGKPRLKRRRPLLLRWGLPGLLICAALVGAYVYATRDTSPIPPQLRAQLSFSPFVIPTTTSSYTTSDYKFSTAEGRVQILSYIIHTKDTAAIAVSEYTQPQEFSEIPEYKDRFLTNVAKQDATVQTSNGTIYLGRMSAQGNKQLAVMLERGLIVFLSPDRDLDQAAWRKLGDELSIQKVTE